MGGHRDVSGCWGSPFPQGLPSPHLQEVEHEGGHPAPAVQAVHVGDALGPVGLEDGHDACREEPVSTRDTSSSVSPLGTRPAPVPLVPALTDEGDEQRQAVEQGVQSLGGALGFVPEHPVNQESCQRGGR